MGFALDAGRCRAREDVIARYECRVPFGSACSTSTARKDGTSAWLLAADLVSRDAGFAAWLAIGAVARLRLCRLVAQAGAHELLPSIAAHPDSLRHTFRVVRAGSWIDREEHTDDAS